MSAKKKARKLSPAERARAAARAKAERETPVASTVVVGVLAALASFLLLGFSSLFPVLVVPLLAGTLVGLTVRSELRAAMTAAAGAAAGALVAGIAFQTDTFLGILQRMPDYANVDVTSTLYERFLLPLVQGGPMGTAFRGADGVVLLMAFVALLAGGTAFGVAWYVRQADAAPTRWIAWGAVGLIGVSFFFTAVSGTSTSGFAETMATEPAVGEYSFDPAINLKAVYLMRRGEDYYHALVDAAAGDARLIKGKSVVNGRIGYPSPANIREPFSFYLWTGISLVGGVQMVLYASILLCIVLMALFYLVLKPLLGYRALFVPMFVFPSLLLHTVWYNVLHPDWWATLALLFAAVFLALDRPIVCGAFLLAACLMRETMLLWAAVVFAIMCVRAWRERRWTVPLIYAGMFAAFVAEFVLHLRTAKDFIQTGASSTPFFAYISNNAGMGVIHKFLAPTSYLVLPYGFYSFPAYLLLPLGAAGFYFALADRPWARAATVGFIAAEALYYLTLGATSSYWGQHVMPLAIMGTAALLAVADRALPSVRAAG